MQRVRRRWSIQSWIISSIVVLAFGLWQLHLHSRYWAGSRGTSLSMAGMLAYTGVAVVAGSVFGLLLGLVTSAVALARGASDWSGFRSGYFIGLDLGIVFCMWLVPATS